MDTSQVTAIIRAGFVLLDKAIADVTGDPAELRAKADECSRCAAQIASAASRTNQVVTTLGQTWQGLAYNACNSATTDLTTRLTNILQRDLQQESRRLTAAAQALTTARTTAEQQKQDFAQRANDILKAMMDAIRAASGLHSPWRQIMIALAIMQAMMKAIRAKSDAQAAAEATKSQLSDTLSTLFGQPSTAGRLVATPGV